MAQEEKFIQVGVTALRDPATGEFLPAERIRRYKAGCRAAGVKI